MCFSSTTGTAFLSLTTMHLFLCHTIPSLTPSSLGPNGKRRGLENEMKKKVFSLNKIK
jgi:hypothetical protein